MGNVQRLADERLAVNGLAVGTLRAASALFVALGRSTLRPYIAEQQVGKDREAGLKWIGENYPPPPSLRSSSPLSQVDSLD